MDGFTGGCLTLAVLIFLYYWLCKYLTSRNNNRPTAARTAENAQCQKACRTNDQDAAKHQLLSGKRKSGYDQNTKSSELTTDDSQTSLYVNEQTDTQGLDEDEEIKLADSKAGRSSAAASKKVSNKKHGDKTKMTADTKPSASSMPIDTKGKKSKEVSRKQSNKEQGLDDNFKSYDDPKTKSAGSKAEISSTSASSTQSGKKIADHAKTKSVVSKKADQSSVELSSNANGQKTVLVNDDMQGTWRLNCNEVKLIKDVESIALTGLSVTVTGLFSALRRKETERLKQRNDEQLGLHRNQLVALIPVHGPIATLTRSDMDDLVHLLALKHANLQRFIGVCIDPDRNADYIVECCTRGTLKDLLVSEASLDIVFRKSFIANIILGMEYVHKSSFKSHGRLTSSSCHVTGSWTIKIGIMVLPPFLDEENSKQDDASFAQLLWTAPELLRVTERPVFGTPKGDVYSFAILVQQITFFTPPFMTLNLEPRDIINRVKIGGSTPYRPVLPLNEPNSELQNDIDVLMDIMKRCWSEDPSSRPSFATLSQEILNLDLGKNLDLVDHVLEKLERYSSSLEQIVKERTAELYDQREKSDELLYSMIPPLVAEKLKKGQTIHPEFYKSVTICFSDVVGFTAICSVSTPFQVVDFINDLYRTLDDNLVKHDVCKVETIGDSYMVVSGLPTKNKGRHVCEIANLALDLLNAAMVFKIGHMPGAPLKLRMGMHTGPCAAGVVGKAMPHYTLFGDTVNFASRMESTGVELNIQMSKQAHTALTAFGGYQTKARGEVYVKGKGNQETYWLLSKEAKKNKPGKEVLKTPSGNEERNTASGKGVSESKPLNTNAKSRATEAS